MIRRRLHRLGALAVTTAMVLGACGGDSDTASPGGTTTSAEDAQPASVERLRLAGGDFGYPSPFGYVRGPGWLRAGYTFDTLLWEDSTGEPIPWLAREWEVSDDAKEWRFTIHEGVTFTDGTPLTVDDVVFSFEYLMSGPGAQTQAFGVRSVGVVDEVVADGGDVVIRLKQPFAPFVEDIAQTVHIIPRHIWEGVADPARFRDPTALVGSGPYKLESLNEAEGTYLYVANEDFHLGVPYVKRIELVPAQDELQALQRGELDAAGLSEEGVPEEVLKPFETSDQYGVISDPGNWNLALHFNLEKGFPYSEVKFRQAIAYAVDRKDMVDRILLGRGVPGSLGALAPEHPMAAEGLPAYEHDVEEARRLLDEIGIRDADGDGTRELPDGSPFRQELQTSTRFSPKSAELIKEYLRDVGIEVDIRSLDRAAADAAAQEGNFTMALVGYGGLMGDPEALSTRFSSTARGGGFSRARGYANPEYDALAKSQLTTLDEEERKAQVVEMQEILARDLPVISLYVPDRTMIYRKGGFTNWYFTPGCSPCGATGNKHMLVTGRKVGFGKEAD
jgi:peptide/nickel transport system substrate-binding protein